MPLGPEAGLVLLIVYWDPGLVLAEATVLAVELEIALDNRRDKLVSTPAIAGDVLAGLLPLSFWLGLGRLASYVFLCWLASYSLEA